MPDGYGNGSMDLIRAMESGNRADSRSEGLSREMKMMMARHLHEDHMVAATKAAKKSGVKYRDFIEWLNENE